MAACRRIKFFENLICKTIWRIATPAILHIVLADSMSAELAGSRGDVPETPRSAGTDGQKHRQAAFCCCRGYTDVAAKIDRIVSVCYTFKLKTLN